jgi:glutamyl-tRNA reductase
VNKVLHDPTVFLKAKGHKEEKSLYLDITRRLFNLDDPSKKSPESEE